MDEPVCGPTCNVRRCVVGRVHVAHTSPIAEVRLCMHVHLPHSTIVMCVCSFLPGTSLSCSSPPHVPLISLDLSSYLSLTGVSGGGPARARVREGGRVCGRCVRAL